METGYNLTASAAGRIGRMLRDYENGRLGRRPESDQDQIPGVGGVAFVIVTGTTAGYPAGEYDGTLSWFDAENNVWVSQFDPIRIRELNGGTLATGNKYQAEYLETIDGKEVFTVQASGGGGTSGSTFVVVKITSALPPLTGVQSTYNEISKTWSDGTTNLTLVEANGNNIPVGKRVLAMKSGNVYIIALDPMAVTSVVCNGGTLTVVGRN